MAYFVLPALVNPRAVALEDKRRRRAPLAADLNPNGCGRQPYTKDQLCLPAKG